MKECLEGCLRFTNKWFWVDFGNLFLSLQCIFFLFSQFICNFLGDHLRNSGLHFDTTSRCATYKFSLGSRNPRGRFVEIYVLGIDQLWSGGKYCLKDSEIYNSSICMCCAWILAISICGQVLDC